MVFLFFIFAILVSIIFSTVKFDVRKLNISNIDKIKLEYDYLIYIKLYAFGFIKFFQIKLDKSKLKDIKFFKKIDYKKIKEDLTKTKFNLSDLKIEIQTFYLNLKCGTASFLLTNLLILLSSISLSFLFSNLIKKYSKEKHVFKIEPLYKNKLLIDLKFNCIIKIKMVHIINMICMLLGKRSEMKNARTSNRRFNDDSHEQYPRYDRC